MEFSIGNIVIGQYIQHLNEIKKKQHIRNSVFLVFII